MIGRLIVRGAAIGTGDSKAPATTTEWRPGLIKPQVAEGRAQAMSAVGGCKLGKRERVQKRLDPNQNVIKRGNRGVGFGLVFVASRPALMHWQFARWGMTEEPAPVRGWLG